MNFSIFRDLAPGFYKEEAVPEPTQSPCPHSPHSPQNEPSTSSSVTLTLLSSPPSLSSLRRPSPSLPPIHPSMPYPTAPHSAIHPSGTNSANGLPRSTKPPRPSGWIGYVLQAGHRRTLGVY